MAWQNEAAAATSQRAALDEEQRRLMVFLGITTNPPSILTMWKRVFDQLGIGNAAQTLVERLKAFTAGTDYPTEFAWLRLGTTALAYTNTVAASGTTGTAYSSGSSATGGAGPYTYAVVSGSLPTGLTLNASTGVVTGTPTVAGAYPYTIQVTDAVGSTKTISGTITIVAALAYVNTIPTTGTTGVAFTGGSSATGGTSPYTYALTAGALPDGLTVNTTTGVVSGTPTVAAAFNYTIQVTDSASATKTISGTITITAP